MRGWGYWVLAVGCLTGCAETEGSRYTSPAFQTQAPPRVAVLPFDNQSVDLVGPELLRKLVVANLKDRGYDPVPIETVDESLRTLGITDGGQLRAVTAKQVGAALGVDGLFYGDVEDFSFLNVGFALRRLVRLHLRFVLAPSEDKLWEDTEHGLTEFFTWKKREAWRAFMEGLAVREVQNLLRTPLLPEAQEAVRRLFVNLPPRPIAVVRP